MWKAEALASINGKGDVELVIDDDARVCRALTELGYSVLQAWWGIANGA